jgi:hypothetical protein
MLARERDAIRALFAALAVPLPPVPACVAYLTMPGVAVLDDPLPAEGIPVRLATLLATIVLEKPLQGNDLTLTGQFVLLRQLLY